MRCKFCGSKAIYPYTQHEQATAGRVVAGAIIAGAIGAAAGLAGKNVKGYRCSACGMFSEQPMDFGEEMLINSAVSDAKNGKTVIYERYQEKYANLEFVPVRQVVKQESALLPDEDYDEDDVELLPEAEPVDESIKHSYCPNQYVVGSPVFISNVTIKDDNGTDVLLLEVNNISGKTLRSVYLNITVYDDVGDQIGTSTFAFQGLSAATGEQLPQAKPFSLNTNVAYKVNVVCEKAAFTDDTVWRKEENPTIYSVPEKTELVPESFAQHKYLRVLLAKKGALRVGQKLYYPVVEETHRLCVCGNPAVSGSKCLACGLSEADLQEVMDYDVLVQCRKDVIVKTARERTEALHRFIEQSREDTYQTALQLMEEESYAEALQLFESVAGHKNTEILIEKCKEKVEIFQKDKTYYLGMMFAEDSEQSVENYTQAITEFEKIPGWKDADEQIAICQQKIEELKAQEEADRQASQRKAEEEQIAARKAQEKRKRTKILAVAAISVIVIFIILLVTVIIPNVKYNNAVEMYGEEFVQDFQSLDVGDQLVLGTYEQDNNMQNGQEGIEWVVLARDGNKVLVISKYAIDCLPYNKIYSEVSWANCTLRTHLNFDFIHRAFTPEEQKLLVTTKVSPDPHPEKPWTDQGSSTKDKVFLLSVAEANQYGISGRRWTSTAYTLAQAGTYKKVCEDWLRLRTSFSNQITASVIQEDGSVDHGIDVHYACCIRPVMWLSLGF